MAYSTLMNVELALAPPVQHHQGAGGAVRLDDLEQGCQSDLGNATGDGARLLRVVLLEACQPGILTSSLGVSGSWRLQVGRVAPSDLPRGL